MNDTDIMAAASILGGIFSSGQLQVEATVSADHLAQQCVKLAFAIARARKNPPKAILGESQASIVIRQFKEK